MAGEGIDGFQSQDEHIPKPFSQPGSGRCTSAGDRSQDTADAVVPHATCIAEWWIPSPTVTETHVPLEHRSFLAYTAVSMANELKAWIDIRRGVAEAERRATRGEPMEPGTCLERTLALVALYGRLHGWPPPEDAVSLREAEMVRRNWSRVRACFRERGECGA